MCRTNWGRRDATGRNENTHRKSDATLLPSASGRILDETGKPVSEIKLALTPVVDGNGTWFPIRQEQNPRGDAPPFHAESDAAGRFNITTAIDGPVLLSLFPSRKSRYPYLKKSKLADSFSTQPEGRNAVLCLPRVWAGVLKILKLQCSSPTSVERYSI